jgi:sucrose phosphorylase
MWKELIMALKNQVQLITYPDSLGGNLSILKTTLDLYLKGVFPGGLHILPPFPSSGDRGFAPLTYLDIEPSFGTWENIREIAAEYPVLLDLMVNHISRKSEYFQDFLKYGSKSSFANLFITLDKLWADGQPVEEDISLIFLRRKRPFSQFETGPEKKRVSVWTTFGKENPSEQIDLDINAKVTRDLLTDYLENFKRNQISIVRLDAVGYVVKKVGTSCFFVEPEINDFLDWIHDKADSMGLVLLPEVHSHHSIQFKLAEKGFWIYDFILPFLILNTFIKQSSAALLNYLKTRPEKQFTMLDCHDGIPVKPDLDGVVTPQEARQLIDICMLRGANLSYVFSDKHKDADGFDVHQIRGTIYSLLDCNDDAYLAARAVQFFTPGIPQVYYVGLLAGENDVDKVSETGDGREVNRHNYSMDEIISAVEKPVVQRLIKLIRFRNEHPAFNGKLTVTSTADHTIELSWQLEHHSCQLNVDLISLSATIKYTNEAGLPELYIV